MVTKISRSLVERIIAYNSFSSYTSTRARFLKSLADGAQHQPPEASGVWILASYINHSCLGNCCRSFIGAMQIVRATEDLPPGTELVFP